MDVPNARPVDNVRARRTQRVSAVRPGMPPDGGTHDRRSLPPTGHSLRPISRLGPRWAARIIACGRAAHATRPRSAAAGPT